MSRAKNKIQDKYEFNCEIDIRINDINYAGHVGNSQMVGIAHDARIRLFKSLGLSEGNLGDGKTGIVIADLTVNFKSELFPDNIVVVKSHIGEIEKSNFRIFHHLTNNDKTVALVETGIVAFDYINRKKAKLPEEFYKALKNYYNNSAI